MNQVTEFDPQKATAEQKQDSLWEIRTQEQPYAFLKDPTHQPQNRYGQKIDLLEINPDWKPGQPLFINDNPEVGSNPNRNKQHAFFFTADNCIGCHACEAACSEKNNNPGHIAFRSVGYVEGGCYPDYKRMNISMACNHCDDPVCLKGCPTKAYTKHTEYGAVLQDPETCFGCGYCTWVCPYNAPQLDPIQGQVSKCNMCVDRLEVGLKPACVSACLGNALDFGVVENIPDNRVEAKTAIPGFPDPEITHPNIRFQQTRGMPEEMVRTDSTPIKYHRNAQGTYRPVVDPKEGLTPQWSLRKLSSRENPLVMFTLFAQAAIGAFTVAFLGSLVEIPYFRLFRDSDAWVGLVFASCFLVALGLFFSTTHLGKPLRFYRGFNNLRYSPVCREGLGLALFIAFGGLHLLFSLPGNSTFTMLVNAWTGVSLVPTALTLMLANVFGVLGMLAGAGGLYYMIKCYRIKARPFWNHWNVTTDFVGTALSLGGWLTGSLMLLTFADEPSLFVPAHDLARLVLAIGISLMLVGLTAHGRAMRAAEHEGAASWYIQSTVFGKTQALRMGLLYANLVLCLVMVFINVPLVAQVTLWLVSGALLLGSHVIGRALFYVLVIPTTMPGAFFWKNKGFEQHARDIGLADMPQVGLVSNGH